jgi:hypothetical protein
MSRKRYLRVRNFDATQHYKDRNPIWIKLYCSILDDYDFAQLPDETKFHAVGLMLLASRLNNKFPADEIWLRAKINAEKEINLNLLLEIRFLEVAGSEKGVKTDENFDGERTANARKSMETKDNLDSATFQDEKSCAIPEQKREEENRKEHNTTQRDTLEEETAVCVNSENSSQNNGHLSQFSLEECFKYVEICKSNGENIKNPKGLATSLFENGKADAFILATLYPEENEKREIEIYGEPKQFSEEPCAVCFGSKMEVVKGFGARPCPHCKNEKGHATGKQPKGDGMMN